MFYFSLPLLLALIAADEAVAARILAETLDLVSERLTLKK